MRSPISRFGDGSCGRKATGLLAVVTCAWCCSAATPTTRPTPLTTAPSQTHPPGAVGGGISLDPVMPRLDADGDATVNAPENDAGGDPSESGLITLGQGTGLSRGSRGDRADGAEAGGKVKLPTESPIMQVMAQLAYERVVLQSHDRLKELGLNKSQMDALDAATKTHVTELAAVQQAHRTELFVISSDASEAQDQIKAAAGGVDLDLIYGLYAKHEAYYRETLAVQRKWRKAISDVLTPAQRIRWLEIPIREQLMARAGDLRLSSEQKARFDTLCHDAAERVERLPEPRSHVDLAFIIRDASQKLITVLQPEPQRPSH